MKREPGRGEKSLTHQPPGEGGAVEGELPSASELVRLGRGACDRPEGHRAILCEAGPHTHGGLLALGLVDELFLTISPLVAGDRGHMSRYGFAEAVDLAPPGLRGHLLSVRQHAEHVFLRYDLEGGLLENADAAG